MNPILLDTHAAIWSAEGTLAGAVARTIDAAADREELLLSPISAWEIGMLVRKGRLALAPSLHDYVRALFAQPGVVTALLTPAIAAASTALPAGFPADPADCLLIATASAYGASLVTRDRKIRDYARTTKHLRCIAC